VATPRFIRQLVDLGKQVHVWTINDSSMMARLFDQGVTGIVTDRTDRAVVVRKKFLAGDAV
jgi:glycerophosphoryl diester phosphodiesterase